MAVQILDLRTCARGLYYGMIPTISKGANDDEYEKIMLVGACFPVFGGTCRREDVRVDCAVGQLGRFGELGGRRPAGGGRRRGARRIGRFRRQHPAGRRDDGCAVGDLQHGCEFWMDVHERYGQPRRRYGCHGQRGDAPVPGATRLVRRDDVREARRRHAQPLRHEHGAQLFLRPGGRTPPDLGRPVARRRAGNAARGRDHPARRYALHP